MNYRSQQTIGFSDNTDSTFSTHNSDSRASSENRRNWLAQTSTVAASLAATPLLQRSVHSAGNEELRIGLIGCGGRGTGAAQNAMNGDKYGKVVALADAYSDRLTQCRQSLTRQSPQQFTVTDDHCFVGLDAYKQLIDNANVDVVLLCSPPHFRPAHLEAAINAGKHIFCEKPIATDPTGVRKVLELARRAEEKKLNLVSGLCWRYDPGVKETIKRLQDGAIGDIVAIQENYLTGTLWQRGRKPEWSDMEYQMRNWLYYKWLSGDHIVEQFIHSLDKSLWLHNDEPPKTAYGLGGRQVRTGAEFGDVYDHFSVVYEWENGVRTFAHTRQMADCFSQVEDFIYGTKGSAKVLANQIESYDSKWKYDGPKPSMYDEEHRELFAAIRDGRAINNGKYMCYSTLMAIMGREACYSGKVIEWDKLLNSPQDLSPPNYEPGSAPAVEIPVPGKYRLA